MKIRALQAENFRKFRDPISLTGFHDGLNLVCEPNEAGKSKVLDAMRAALFENHKSRNQRTESFQPSGDDVAPVIELDFEIDGARWRVRKRFVLKPEALLTAPDGRRAQGDAAEEQLQALLGFTRQPAAPTTRAEARWACSGWSRTRPSIWRRRGRPPAAPCRACWKARSGR